MSQDAAETLICSSAVTTHALSSFASLRMTTLRYNGHWQAEPSLRSESVSGLSGLPRLRLEFPDEPAFFVGVDALALDDWPIAHSLHAA